MVGHRQATGSAAPRGAGQPGVAADNADGRSLSTLQLSAATLARRPLRDQRVIIQTLRTQWTKLSRGAPMAAARNAIPDVLDLPASAATQAEVAWHDAFFAEPDFVKSEQFRWTDLAAVRVPGLDLISHPTGSIQVDVFGQRQFALQPGETGAVVYNWVDDVIEDAWRSSVYHKVSAHIANGVPWSTTIFREAPHHASRWLRDLA